MLCRIAKTWHGVSNGKMVRMNCLRKEEEVAKMQVREVMKQVKEIDDGEGDDEEGSKLWSRRQKARHKKPRSIGREQALWA